MWKSLPIVALVIVSGVMVGCAAGHINDFLAAEARYTDDAEAVGRYRQDHGIREAPELFAQEAVTYDRLTASRAAQYSTESVAALTRAIEVLETDMVRRGISNGNRAIPAN